MPENKVKVEIWSDIMCPFCYIGKRHFEQAVASLPNPENIEVEWKSFQIDPEIPEQITGNTNVYEYLAERKGITVQQSMDMHKSVVEMAANAGLSYRFDIAKVANSKKAHCIIQFAKTKNLGDKAEEEFFKAYFFNGKDLSLEADLLEISEKIGITAEEMQFALTDESYAYAVKQDVQEADALGIRGVPFFVFNRKYGVSGAQPAQAFIDTINQVMAETT